MHLHHSMLREMAAARRADDLRRADDARTVHLHRRLRVPDRLPRRYRAGPRRLRLAV